MISGDVAFIRHRWQMRLGNSPSIAGASTEVALRQDDGSWLYAIDHPVIEGLIAETSAKQNAP